MDAVLAVLPGDLDDAYRVRLKTYAFEVAGRALQVENGADPGPEPEAPRLLLALPPGPSSGPADNDPPPCWREPDTADRVLAQLARFEDEFGSLENDDE